MLINEKYNKIVATLRKRGKFIVSKTHPLPLDRQLEAFKAVILLAKQMQIYAKDLMEQKKHITVLLAGCDWSETFAGGETYSVLNELLGTDHTWDIKITGDEIRGNSVVGENIFLNSFSMSPSSADENVRISITECRLEEAIVMFGYPDVLVLNHAGFESFYDSWFENDTLSNAVDAGVLVLGASYGQDEVQIDRYYLRAFGFELEDSQTNPTIVNHAKLASRMSAAQKAQLGLLEGSLDSNAMKGMMNWGETIWKMGRSSESEELLLERQEIIKCIRVILETTSEYGQKAGFVTHPSEVACSLMFEKDGVKFIRVGGSFVLDLAEYEVFDEVTGGCVIEEVEFDTSNLDGLTEGNLMYAMALSANVFKQVITPYIDEFDFEPSLGEAGFVDSGRFGAELPDGLVDDEVLGEVLSEALGELFGGEVDSEVFKHLGSILSREPVELTNDAKQVIAHLEDRDVDSVLAMPDEALRGVRDGLDRNLILMSAMINDEDLYLRGLEVGCDPFHRDGDGFSVLDVAVEHSSLDLLRFILQRGDVRDMINSTNWVGNSVMDVALRRGASSPIVELLREYGAKPQNQIGKDWLV